MIVGIVDTTVLIHLYRNNPDAVAWAGSQTQQLAITSITWLEFMVGAKNKVAQTSCKVILNQFDLWHLTVADQDWAMQQMEQYQLSRGVSINDYRIASTPLPYRFNSTSFAGAALH